MRRLLVYLFIVFSLSILPQTQLYASVKYSCSNLEVKFDGKYLECLQKELRTIERLVYSKSFDEGLSETEVYFINTSIDSMENALKNLSSQFSETNIKEKKILNNLIKDIKTLDRAVLSANFNANENKKNEPVDIWNVKANSLSNKVDVIFCKHKDYEKVTTNITKSPINKNSRKFKKYLKVREVLIFNDRTKCPRSYKNISYIEVKASPIFQNQHDKFCYNSGTKVVYSQRKETNDYLSIYKIQDILKKWKYLDNSSIYGRNSCKQKFSSHYGPIKFASYNNGINVFVRDNINTEIAKAEPSQTQKFSKNEIIENYLIEFENLKENFEGLNNRFEEFNYTKTTKGFNLENIEKCNNYLFQIKKLSSEVNKSMALINKMHLEGITAYISEDVQTREDFLTRRLLILSEYEDQLNKIKKINKFDCNDIKIVEVAKVEELKQEEFKPKTKDIDNDVPIIEIAEAITFDSQAYTLKGKVKDKSQIYLTIDGRQVQVKKGKFELERFNIDPDVAEEIKIVAIDKWNNRAEKTIKVTIDLQSTDIAKVYEDLNPNNVKVKTDKNKIAIIIGIEKYENLNNLDAKYANRDAKAFRAYATRALGIKPSNLKILIDDKATRSQVLKAFKLWLPKIAGDGGKDIHLFFAGHGLASDNGEDLYILPQDGESSLLEDTAISRVELISLINKVSPRSVTMFFDTCYSGQTRDERMLVASLRPIRIVADEQDTPTNFTIFTASNYDQTSGSIEEAKHGMFSYYLMKGLEGKADENEDKKITNGELIAYLKDNVSQEAFTQNRQQDPMLSGDPDKVLMSYR